MSWAVVAGVGASLVGSYLGSKGSGGDPYAQARADEEARRKEIHDAQKRIEGIFSSPQRQQQYADFVAANRDLLFSELDRTRDVNARELKFALARSGLSGGSTDIDQNRNLAETYLRGIGQAETKAQRAGAELQASDQQAKQQLFSQLLAGADVSTSVQNAAQMMRTNIGAAREEGYFGAFDKLFGDYGQIYKQSKEAAGERRARHEFGLNTLFQPSNTPLVPVAGGINTYG
jgi:hypothetical protein